MLFVYGVKSFDRSGEIRWNTELDIHWQYYSALNVEHWNASDSRVKVEATRTFVSAIFSSKRVAWLFSFETFLFLGAASTQSLHYHHGFRKEIGQPNELLDCPERRGGSITGTRSHHGSWSFGSGHIEWTAKSVSDGDSNQPFFVQEGDSIFTHLWVQGANVHVTINAA